MIVLMVRKGVRQGKWVIVSASGIIVGINLAWGRGAGIRGIISSGLSMLCWKWDI